MWSFFSQRLYFFCACTDFAMEIIGCGSYGVILKETEKVAVKIIADLHSSCNEFVVQQQCHEVSPLHVPSVLWFGEAPATAMENMPTVLRVTGGEEQVFHDQEGRKPCFKTEPDFFAWARFDVADDFVFVCGRYEGYISKKSFESMPTLLEWASTKADLRQNKRKLICGKMTHVGGHTLSECFHKLSCRSILGVAAQVFGSLADLRNNGFKHNDLTTDNIMVQWTPRDAFILKPWAGAGMVVGRSCPRAILIDFGVAITKNNTKSILDDTGHSLFQNCDTFDSALQDICTFALSLRALCTSKWGAKRWPKDAVGLKYLLQDICHIRAKLVMSNSFGSQSFYDELRRGGEGDKRFRGRPLNTLTPSKCFFDRAFANVVIRVAV